MFPFLSGESREKLPAGSRGGFFHENDPGRQTILSRIFSIFNNVANLELTPEVRAVLANRQNTDHYDELPSDQKLVVQDSATSEITPEDIMSHPASTEALESPQSPQSIEEIRKRIELHALPIGSRSGVPQDVARSIEGANDERLALGA